MTCPHCKFKFTEPDWIEVCAECGSPDLHNIGIEDETIMVCSECSLHEPSTKPIAFCPDCQEAL